MGKLEFLTPKEAGKIIGTSHAYILQRINNGELKAIKLGRVYKIRPEELEKFMDNNAV